MSHQTTNTGDSAKQSDHHPHLSESEDREQRRLQALARIIGHRLPPAEEYDGCWLLDRNDPVFYPKVEFWTNFPGAE
jgi:hypothetical protein